MKAPARSSRGHGHRGRLAAEHDAAGLGFAAAGGADEHYDVQREVERTLVRQDEMVAADRRKIGADAVDQRGIGFYAGVGRLEPCPQRGPCAPNPLR